jgi:hypothetical protein
MAAASSRCYAADTTTPQLPHATVVDWVDGDYAEQQPAQQAPAKPAVKTGTLADALIGLFGGETAADRRQAQAALEQQIRAQEAECRPVFQQTLYVELALLRRSCKPDAKVFAAVAKAAKADLHVSLHEYVVAMNSPQVQGEITSGQPARSVVQKLLITLAKAKLGPEKAQLYRQECDKRTEARKHAVLVNLVAALDERIVLTAQQRAKLVGSLSAKYDKSWEQYETLNDFSQCLQLIPEGSLLPLLDPKQKIVWQDIAKQDGSWQVDQEVELAEPGDATETQEIARMVENVKDDR